MHQNDLFQRVVGFRHRLKAAELATLCGMFPSLSESSGFPTVNRVRRTTVTMSTFPSLSESSGFPTLPFYDCLLKLVLGAKNDNLTKLVLV